MAVHQAVRAMRTEGFASLTIQTIAERAEVTPSTIYRRWGTLDQLLSEVTAKTLHADLDLVDTGTLKGDLEAWARNFVDDFSTGIGQSLVAERMANPALAKATAGYAFENFETIGARARMRGEVMPNPDRLMDMLVAPIFFRLLLVGQTIHESYVTDLVRSILETPRVQLFDSAQASLRS